MIYAIYKYMRDEHGMQFHTDIVPMRTWVSTYRMTVIYSSFMAVNKLHKEKTTLVKNVNHKLHTKTTPLCITMRCDIPSGKITWKLKFTSFNM